MFRHSIAAILLSLSPALGAEALYGPYSAEVVRVIDGDSIVLNVAIWPGLTKQISLRLDKVNTPEKRGAPECEKIAAAKATEFTKAWLGNGNVTVSGVHLGKFAGRALGRISRGGEDLGEALVAAGLARPYDGGRRETWCGG